MQQTSATFDSIVASGKYIVEYRLIIGGDTYTQSEITKPPVISSGLFEEFSVGNAVASQLEVDIVPHDIIPSMAQIRVQYRVKRQYSLTYSGWYHKGRFYIDTRQLGHDGIMHITAYDAMLKSEYTFMESGSWVSTTTKAVVDMIASDMGISVDSQTSQILNDGKVVPIVPVIGPDGTTARKMLCAIASMYGGNFIIDEYEHIKLIQFTSGNNLFDINGVGLEQGAIASATGLNSISTTRVRTVGYVPVASSTTYTISSNVNKVFILQYRNNSGGYLNVYSGWQTLPYTFTTDASAKYIRIVFAKDDSTTIQPSYVEWVQLELGSEATPFVPYQSGVDIGALASKLDTSPAFNPIDRVIVRADYNNEVGYRSPVVTDEVWNAMTGRILEAVVPWTSQTIADDLLDIVSGYIYQPFEALGAQITPAVQLGDVITINGTTSAIYKMIMTLDPRMAKDVSAPYEEEINHEYPYRSPAQRVVENAVTKEELATAGQTVINGSNIKSGTIELGGTDNGNGRLAILDENNTQYGLWDKDKLTIWDDTTGLDFETAKLRVIREGDDPDTEYGIFIGTGQLYEQFFPGTYPNECTPFINIKGTRNYQSTVDDTGGVQIYPSNVIVYDGSGNMARILSSPEAIQNVPSDPIVTRTGGASTSFTATLYTWGRVAMLTIAIQHGSSVGSFGNYFTGTLKDGYRPVATVHAHTSWYEHQILASLEPDGSIVLREASGSSSAFNSGTATVTFTYLF